MNDPNDFDFSPRAKLEDNCIKIHNEGDESVSTTFELDSEQMNVAERDRMVELRVKFAVQGMHGVLLHKTPNPRDGPKSKKLAEYQTSEDLIVTH